MDKKQFERNFEKLSDLDKLRVNVFLVKGSLLRHPLLNLVALYFIAAVLFFSPLLFVMSVWRFGYALALYIFAGIGCFFFLGIIIASILIRKIKKEEEKYLKEFFNSKNREVKESESRRRR